MGITGASAGWAIGGLIGSAFAPGQKSQGPRLNDLSVSSSAYGTPIPYTQGSPRIAGQIVWASTKREIATTTRQGKGGSKSKVTTYTYEVDLLILLTDNVIRGVSRVWSNGKILWNKSLTADAATLAASDATSAWTRITAYSGSSSQLPDPTYEAAVGTANAPAYRGRGSVFIESLQLGSSGQLPNLTFEIDPSATTNSLTRLLVDFAGASSADSSLHDFGSGVQSGGTVNNGYYEAIINSSAKTLRYTGAELGKQVGVGHTLEFIFDAIESSTNPSSFTSIFSASFFNLPSGTQGLNINGYGGSVPNANELAFTDSYGSAGWTAAVDFFGIANPHHFAVSCDTAGTYSVYLDGVRIVGPTPGYDLGGSLAGLTMGGSTGGAHDITIRYKAIRVHRAQLYSGATITPPTAFTF
jgi:hypothetical protein